MPIRQCAWQRQWWRRTVARRSFMKSIRSTSCSKSRVRESRTRWRGRSRLRAESEATEAPPNVAANGNRTRRSTNSPQTNSTPVTVTVTVTGTCSVGTRCLVQCRDDANPPRRGRRACVQRIGRRRTARAGLVVPAKPRRARARRDEEEGAGGLGDALRRCRDCPEETWYFNLRRFEPQGAGVTFRKGRAVALFTVWSPPGWRTYQGLRDPGARVPDLQPGLLRIDCGPIPPQQCARTTTAIYVVDGQVWGFGSQPGQPVCR